MFKFKRLRKIRRGRQIISVFVKYGIDYLIDQNKISLLARIGKKQRDHEKSSAAEKFRMALEELGPAFIKFGQILSTRPDFLPPAFIKELEKLQDQSPPFDSNLAIQIIERELGKPINGLFEKFETEPIAAASLSQVHKAILSDDDIVAIKIQRPNIHETIELDLSILEDLAGLVENRLQNGWNYHPRLMVEEFKKAIRKELDFSREAHNYEKFRNNFKNINYIRVPKVYWGMTTSVVLTMEFIEGVKINEITQDKYKGIYYPKQVAIHGAEAILKQILEDGFFHADPHPANLFVQPPADIIMLDVGMVGYLDKKTTIEGAKLLKAIVDRDAEKTFEIFENLKIIVKEIDRNLFCQDLTELFDSYLGIPLKNLDLTKIGQDIMEIAMRHNLTFPSNLVLMVKALSMVETIGKSLYPELDVLSIAKPFVRKISKKKIEPKELFKKSETLLQESLELIEELPQGMNMIFQKVQDGNLKFITENQDLKKLSGSIGHAGGYISLGLVIAALIIGSSLIFIHQQSGFFIFGYPILGFLGYLIALVLCLVLVISILRTGK